MKSSRKEDLPKSRQNFEFMARFIYVILILVLANLIDDRVVRLVHSINFLSQIPEEVIIFVYVFLLFIILEPVFRKIVSYLFEKLDK